MSMIGTDAAVINKLTQIGGKIDNVQTDMGTNWYTVRFYVYGDSSLDLTGLKGTVKSAFVIMSGAAWDVIADGAGGPNHSYQQVTVEWDTTTVANDVTIAYGGERTIAEESGKNSASGNTVRYDVTSYVTMNASNNYDITFTGSGTTYGAGAELVLTYDPNITT